MFWISSNDTVINLNLVQSFCKCEPMFKNGEYRIIFYFKTGQIEDSYQTESERDEAFDYLVEKVLKDAVI